MNAPIANGLKNTHKNRSNAEISTLALWSPDSYILCKPPNAQSIVERSPSTLRITIPLNYRDPMPYKTAVQAVMGYITYALVSFTQTCQTWCKKIKMMGVLKDLTSLVAFVLATFLLTTLALKVAIFLGVLKTLWLLFIAALFVSFRYFLRDDFLKKAKQGYLTGQEDRLYLLLRPNIFEMQYLVQGTCTYSVCGKTDELIVSMEICERSNAHNAKFTCAFIEASNVYRFGHHLSRAEQEWLVDEISMFLKSMRQSSES